MARRVLFFCAGTPFKDPIRTCPLEQGDQIAHCLFWVAERNRQPIAIDRYQGYFFSYRKVNTFINNPSFSRTDVFDVWLGQHNWSCCDRWIAFD